MWTWHAGGFWAMWLWMVLFWAVLIVLVVWAVRQFAPRSGPRDGSAARRILEERFARGEIDEEEFRRRARALEELP